MTTGPVKKTKHVKTYEQNVHVWGRIWMVCALLMMLAVPIVISSVIGVFPQPAHFFTGFLMTALIFWTVTTIEVFTFSPMLGSGGTYLGFVTGNLTNLKVPAAMNAMNAADVKMGSAKGDLISTIAIGASTIITTVIIFAGAMLIHPLTPLLEAPAVEPAFDNIIPALFGALGVVYISRNWKIAIAPVVVMCVIFLTVPDAMELVGVLVPVGCIVSIVVTRILYRKNKL